MPFTFLLITFIIHTKLQKKHNMINLKNVFKYYDSKFQRTFVLKDIDLEIKEGEFISIMGPSGAGARR